MALNQILLLTYFTGHRIAIRPSLLLVISINLQQQQLRLLRLPIPVARCCSIRPMSCALSILRSRGAEEQFPCPQQSAISDDRYIMNPHSRRAATIYGRHQRPFESVYTLTAAPFAIIIKHWAKASRGTHRTPTWKWTHHVAIIELRCANCDCAIYICSSCTPMGIFDNLKFIHQQVTVIMYSYRK